jgi:hypothetical protein
MDLGEKGWGGMDWIHMAQDRDQRRDIFNTDMNIQVAYSVGKFLNSRATGGFSRKTQLHGVKKMENAKVKLSLGFIN